MKTKKIEEIWKDLEGSYLKIGEPRGLSRVDFLKKLISYKGDGTHGIGYLIKTINEDMTNPEVGDYLEVCSLLISLFNYLSSYINEKGIPEQIDNLSQFLVSMIEVKEEVKASDLNKLYNKVTNDAIEYPYSKMISLFGCVESYSCFIKDKSKSRNMSPKFYKGFEMESENFKVLDGRYYQTFLERNHTTKDKFIGDCARVIIILMQNEKLPNKIYVTSSDNIKDGKLFNKDVKLKFEIPYDNYKVMCYSVCDFEVYCIC